ncbi:MAG: DM13 domain-containing protein [Hyphomicrobiales bacterium]
MKKILMTAVIAGGIGFVAGNAFWYLASPLWIDNIVSEELPAALQTNQVAQGSFRDADSAHKGKGTATIFEIATGSNVLHLTDFESTNGPDLEVWLVRASDIQSSSDVKGSEWISLGRLKGNIGDQTYIIPEGTAIADYRSVVIWCEQFGVLFSAADLSI